jgi:tetratricopeptide (TPR) repeat protein
VANDGSTQGAAPRRHFVPPFAYEAYVRGELALAANEPERAVLQFELATAAPEEDAFLLSRLAEAQARSGDHEGARRSLAEAERVDACQEEIWLTRGRWAEAAGDRAGAEAAYERARGCAPWSERAKLALYRALKAAGREAEALKLLHDTGAERRDRSESVVLLHALEHEDVGAVRFALDSWLAAGSLSSAELERMLLAVTARREPSLALSFRALDRPLTRALSDSDQPRVRAELALQCSDRAGLRALLAEHSEQALGGAEPAARFAFAAHDWERAELYATLALNGKPNDALRALKAEAASALGEHEAALAETRAISDPTLQQKVARAQLSRLGFARLADELARSALAEQGAQ